MRSARLARSKRGRGRKATEVTEPSAPAAKAQKAVDGDVAQQSATPWRGVLMVNCPYDPHTIQALIARVEQLEKLIQNNQAQSNVQHDNCRQHRMESFATDRAHAQIQQAAAPCCLWHSRELRLYQPRSTDCTRAKCVVRGFTQLSSAPCQLRLLLGQMKGSTDEARAVLVELTTVSAKHRAFKASSHLRANRIRLDEDLTTQQMQQRKGLSSDFLGLKVRGVKPFFRGTTLKYRDAGVVRQCAKGGANKIRAPAPTVPGPRPAHRPEHTNVAMNPAEVLRQAGVSVSREFDFGPALPFTMGTMGSDSELPALQLHFLGLWAPFPADCLASVITRCRYMIALLSMCRCDLWVRDLLLFWPLQKA